MLPDELGRLVFRRVVAIEGMLHRWKLDHHIAAARRAFQFMKRAAPRQEMCAEPFEGRLCRRYVTLVALRIANIDARTVPLTDGWQTATTWVSSPSAWNMSMT